LFYLTKSADISYIILSLIQYIKSFDELSVVSSSEKNICVNHRRHCTAYRDFGRPCDSGDGIFPGMHFFETRPGNNHFKNTPVAASAIEKKLGISMTLLKMQMPF